MKMTSRRTFMINKIVLSDLDNCKWSGPEFCRFAIKKFAIIKKFFQSIIILFKILVTFSCQSSSDVFYFIKTYIINQNIIKFNFNLTLPYYIFKLSPIPTLIQKKIKTICNLNNYSMVNQ